MNKLSELNNEYTRKIQWLVRKLDSDRKGKPYKNDEEYAVEIFQIARELWEHHEAVNKLFNQEVTQ